MKLKLLVYSPAYPQQFVIRDVQALSECYNVRLIAGLGNGNLLRLLDSVKSSNFVLCWFGSRGAAIAVLFAKLFKKKVAVIAGGQDVAYAPELNYGLMGKVSHRRFIQFAFNNCDVAIAVSKFSGGELLRWTHPKKVCVIYNGVDIPTLSLRSLDSRKGVLCIARITAQTIRIKGIEFILRAATLLPNVSFTLVGEISKEAYASIEPLIPQNVKIAGALPHSTVMELCLMSKVYVQPSYYESFGVALAEAMAYGCAPVATNRGALPEVIGDAGFYVDYGDYQGLARQIQIALSSDFGHSARARVGNLFSIDKRRNLLTRLIDSLIKDNAVPEELILDRSVLKQK